MPKRVTAMLPAEKGKFIAEISDMGGRPAE
jgi:hypothetical protein